MEAPGPSVVSPPAATREITQADIDAALQEWNGDMDSKRRVQRYMTGHGREKGTAEWLRSEYRDDLPAFPVAVEGATADLPWTKVQRHLARLVKEDRFFTEAELENFEDIDPAAIREQLEQAEEQPSPFVEQVMADVEQLAEEENEPPYEVTITSDAYPDLDDSFAIFDVQRMTYYEENSGWMPTFPMEYMAQAYLNELLTQPELSGNPTVREVFDFYKPIIQKMVLADQAYQNACLNSDRETAVFEGDAAVKRAVSSQEKWAKFRHKVYQCRGEVSPGSIPAEKVS